MIKVIGKKSCSRCEVVKTVLKNKNIAYQYYNIDSLNETDKNKYTSIAKNEGVKSFPLIFKDDKLITLQEV